MKGWWLVVGGSSEFGASIVEWLAAECGMRGSDDSELQLSDWEWCKRRLLLLIELAQLDVV
jgi:hypothetical protein